MNDENLIKPTPSQARELGRRGGIASGKARLRKKHGRELLRLLLSMPETDPRILEEMERLGIAGKDVTSEIAMHARQIEKAKRKADTVAYNAVIKAAGYADDEPVRADTHIHLELTDPSALAGLQTALESGAQPRKPEGEE